MKYQTKKDREKLYRLAAEIVWLNSKKIENPYTGEDFLGSTYSCDILAGLSKLKHYNYVDGKFPEFFMFEPSKEEKNYKEGWWQDDEGDPRAIALLFAAEMCK